MKRIRTANITMLLVGACFPVGADRSVAVDVGNPRVVERPDGYAKRLVFSPDHQIVAMADESDTELRLVDFKSGKTSGLLKGHTNTINSVAFSSDGRRVATGGLDHTIRIWDVTTRRQLAQAEDVPRCISLAFSPDGRTLASGHFDRRLYGLMFWDLKPDGSLKVEKVVKTMSGRHIQVPHLLRYSPDGRWLVFGSGPINIMDVTCGFVRTFENANTTRVPITSYLFFDDKNWLVWANYIGDLTVWDIATGTDLFHLDDPKPLVLIHLKSMARVPGTETVLTAYEYNQVAAWDLKARKVPERSVKVKFPFDGKSRYPSELILSDDGAGLAVLNEKKVYLLDVSHDAPR